MATAVIKTHYSICHKQFHMQLHSHDAYAATPLPLFARTGRHVSPSSELSESGLESLPLSASPTTPYPKPSHPPSITHHNLPQPYPFLSASSRKCRKGGRTQTCIRRALTKAQRLRFFWAWPVGCTGARSIDSSAFAPFLKHFGQHHGKALWVSDASASRSTPRHAAVSW